MVKERLSPDICVIGAGAGGLTVAAAAAAFGERVVLVEKDRMGGDCLNYGCVPSKALIAAARLAHDVTGAGRFGLRIAPPAVDFRSVRNHVRDVIATIAPHDSAERFASLGVRVIRAPARFIGPDTVVAGDVEIRARRFVIAAGSRPMIPPIPGLAEVPFLTNETVFDLAERPGHLLVVGGGPVGIELAQAFRRLGSAVTVVEAARPLGRDDPELAAIALEAVRADGVTILDATRVTAVERIEAGVEIAAEGPAGAVRLAGTHLLLATGRRPNVEELGLDSAGIAHDAAGIRTDAGMRTTNPRVFAVGDITGRLAFTHIAGHQAGLTVRRILFRLPARERRAVLPWVTFTDPELGWVGLSEAEAAVRYGPIRVSRWPFRDNDRAAIERATLGLVKLVATRRGRILGAGVVGRGAGELVALLQLAISQGSSMRALASMIAPYPTLAEAVRRAGLAHYADGLTSPWVKRIIKGLKHFG